MIPEGPDQIRERIRKVKKEASVSAKKRKTEEIKRVNEAEAKAREEEEVVSIAIRNIRAVVFPVDSNKATEKAQIAKREAEEVKRDKKAEVKAKKEARQVAKDKATREIKEAREKAKKAVVARLYSGVIKLAVVSPIDYRGLKKFEEYLSRDQNLRLVFVGGSVHEDTRIVVSVEKPIDLVKILSEMPPVERVVKKGKEIRVILKTEQ